MECSAENSIWQACFLPHAAIQPFTMESFGVAGKGVGILAEDLTGSSQVLEKGLSHGVSPAPTPTPQCINQFQENTSEEKRVCFIRKGNYKGHQLAFVAFVLAGALVRTLGLPKRSSACRDLLSCGSRRSEERGKSAGGGEGCVCEQSLGFAIFGHILHFLQYDNGVPQVSVDLVVNVSTRGNQSLSQNCKI